MKKKNLRNIVFPALLISLIFSVFSTSGLYFRTEGFTGKSAILMYFVGVLLVFWLGVSAFLYFLPVFTDAFYKIRGKELSYKKEGLIVFCLLLVCWLPAFLAVYPGVFGNDGPVEILQVFSDIYGLSAHHPLIHILLLSGCFMAGHALTGDYNAGMVIYCVIQALVMAGCFTYVLLWMKRRGSAFLLRILVLTFFALNPIIQLLVFNTTKDTIFSGLFVVVFTKLIDLLEDTEKTAGSWKWCAGFLALAAGMCLFRKQGYYLLAFVLLGVLVFYLGKKKKALLLLLVSVILGWFLMGPLVNLLGIPQGDSKEMFSVPMQQMARVWVEYDAGNIELDEEDVALLEELIPEEYLQSYHEDNADYVKVGFDTETFGDNTGEYIRLYLKLGIEHPMTYINAFGRMLSGYWDLDQYGYYRSQLYENTYTDPFFNIFDIQRDSLFPHYEQYLMQTVQYTQQMPVLRLIYSQALPVWILAALFVVKAFEKNRAILGSSLLLVGQWGILILSPAMLVRYAFPLILCVPVMVVLLFEKKKDNRSEENG